MLIRHGNTSVEHSVSVNGELVKTDKHNKSLVVITILWSKIVNK